MATPAPGPTPAALLRRGVNLERVTLAWNVIGIVVLAITAIAARSVALAGFGLTAWSRSAPAPWCSGNSPTPTSDANAPRCN